MRQKTTTVESALRLARSHAMKGNLEKARHFYLNVLAKYPQNKKAKKGLKALQDQAAMENQPLVGQSKSALAPQEISDLIALYSAGRLNDALREAERLYQVNPKVPLLHNTLGAIHTGLGQLDAAVTSYERALELKPDYAEAHYNLGNALRGLGQLDAAVASCERALELSKKHRNTLHKTDISECQPDPAQQEISNLIALYSTGKLNEALTEAKRLCQINPKAPLLHNTLGAIHAGLGELDAAVASYKRALKLKPDYAEVHNNLGNALRGLGQLDAAVANCERALKLRPDYAEAHNNLGNALKDLGLLDAAVVSYEQALKLKPDYLEVHNNLGDAFRDLGQLDAAVASCERALKLRPDYAEAHNNLGNALKDLGLLDAAVVNYERALELKPDYAEVHNNLGNALRDLGQLDAAVASCERALKLKPDYTEAHNDLGVTLYGFGQLEAAVACYERALKINPDYTTAWSNLFFSVKALEPSGTSKNAWIDSYKRELSEEVCSRTVFSILEYRLNAVTPHLAEDSFNHAVKALPSIMDEEIHNPASLRQLDKQTPIPQEMIALLHCGRSGTGLLHSLIDSHPEISTLPSIYFSEYFNETIWNSLISNGWTGLPKRFVEQFSVLFDARSSIPVQSIDKRIINLGKKEGMANVGENRAEVLVVDQDIFCAELQILMAYSPILNQGTFFKLAHVAYEKALNIKSNKHTIFYHIHNPSLYSKLNFLRYNPKARLLMMVREPVQNCESWLKYPLGLNNVQDVHNRIITMLFDIDQVAFRTQDSIGVRLEDLKTYPKETIASLCDWMGIEESSSLYEMTAQGKKWWGDPTSPDYGKDGMSPFGHSSIKRVVGSILSEKDQFVLRTLFYPFSVRFGYSDKNPVGFKKDLQLIKPLLNKPFDFEKTLAGKSNINLETFKKSGSYLYLRASLHDRWKVLNDFHDYPYMLKPLKIKSN